MSLGGDIMTEHYDELIQDFYVKLAEKGASSPEPDRSIIKEILKEFKEHFKNNGIY